MASTAPTKKARTTPLIGTHSGTFHADESLAVYLLRLHSSYRGAELVRTRDPKILEECSIVVDVGGVYDHQALRYDHHQRGFDENFGMGFVTKLSSAGLVYKFVLVHASTTSTEHLVTADTTAKRFSQRFSRCQ